MLGLLVTALWFSRETECVRVSRLRGVLLCVGWRLIRILQVRGRWRGKTVVLRRVAGWRLRRIRRMLRRRVGIALRCIATE